MYPSVPDVIHCGRWTADGIAALNGMSLGKRTVGGIADCNGDCNVEGSQSVHRVRSLARDVMVVCCRPYCNAFRCYFRCCVESPICFLDVDFVAKDDLVWVVVSYMVNEVNESEECMAVLD
jgi:hypothetical protein